MQDFKCENYLSFHLLIAKPLDFGTGNIFTQSKYCVAFVLLNYLDGPVFVRIGPFLD